MDSREADRQPILVTGAHRSGTTWVGKMLAAGGQAAYISEPLNVLHRPGVMRAPVHGWYTYICPDNEAEYLSGFRETLALDYHYEREIASLRSVKDGLRLIRDSGIFLQGKLRRQRVLLKDPFAVFSAGWFAERLDCRVLFVVRHPAAFVSSLVRLGWSFDYQDLLQQPLLLRDWLDPFRDDIEKINQTGQDIVGQASLLWVIVYSVVAKLASRYPEMLIARHEDLSLDPENAFRGIYEQLGLDFTKKARQAILASTQAGNPKQVSEKSVHATRLDSRANLANWRKRLGEEDVKRVISITRSVATHFYAQEELTR